jgi:AcrR family transcriptional regulator
MSKAPIWAVAAPGTRKPRFTREQIATAALKIADTEGFEALSMRRVAEELDAGTMTLYYYVRTKEDLLALVEDAVTGEICDACEPLPKSWRPAIVKLATATRATYLRHAWVLRSFTGVRLGPSGMRHIEQSLQALAHLKLEIARKLEILSIVDDYVFGHCALLRMRRGLAQFDRKAALAVNDTLSSYLAAGEFPQLTALIGDDDPAAVLARSSSFSSEEHHFEFGLDALLDGLAKRLRLK